MEDDYPRLTSRLMKFLIDHPLITGGMWTAITVIFSFWLFKASNTSRDLIYYIDPVRTVVARVQQGSRISVLVDRKPTTRDLTAVQIVVWNNGKESIQGENLLGSGLLFIETGPDNPIVEAEVLKTSRDNVIKMSLDSSEIAAGRLGVDWKILEQYDAALLQLVYFGDDSTPIKLSAVVQQPGRIRAYVHWNLLRFVTSALVFVVGVVAGRLGPFVTAYVIHAIWSTDNRHEPFVDVRHILLSFIVTLLLVLLAVQAISILQEAGMIWESPKLPFGL